MGRVTPDAVLDALDPEQRAVARGPARSGLRPRRAPGTGKTRAITHRIAYGVQRRRLEPAPGPRGDVHGTGRGRDARPAARARRRRRPGAHLPRGRPASAALLLAARRRRRDPAHQRAQGRAGRRGRGPAPRSPRARPALRDLAAEIEWAKVTRTVPDDYAAAALAARARGPARRRPAPRWPASTPATRRSSGPGSLIDFEDVLLLTVGVLEDRRGRRRGGALGLPPPHRRRVPGRQPAPAAPARALARATATGPVRRRRREPDDLLASPAPPRPTCSTSRSASPARRSSGWSATTAPPRRSSRWPTGWSPGARGAAATARLELVAQRPAGSRADVHEHDDETAEAAAVAARVQALLAGGRPAQRDRGPVPDQRPVRGLRGGARRRSASPTCCAAASGSSSDPRCGRRSILLLRGAARAGEESTGRCCRDDVGAVLSPGWDPAPAVRWRRPGSAGSRLAALVRLAEDLAAGRPDGRPAATWSPSSTSAAPPSTRRPSRASRSRRCTRPRAWSGTPSSSSASSTARCRSSTPTTAEAVEEERRLLYVGVTRAREHLFLSWAAARSPGGGATGSRSRFLDGLRPVDEAVPAAAPARGRGARSAGDGPTSELPDLRHAC